MRLPLLVLLTSGAVVPLQSQSAPADSLPAAAFALSARLPIDTSVRIGTLPNGLRYYVRQNSRPEDRIELRLVVNAGSVLEDADQQGLAHFTEHMAFNGTRSFARNDIVKYLGSIGVRFGPDLNAQTGFDETIYILPVPADSAAILRQSFRFLSEVASGILFDSADVVAERGVVLAEWRTGLGAGERIRAKQFPVVFRGSRYAERLPIGRPEILETVLPAPLRRYWRDWYRPDLMAVIAVGDANPDSLVSQIRQHFAGLAAPSVRRPRPAVTVPSHGGTLVSIATDREVPTSSVSVLWKRRPTVIRTVADMRRSMLATLRDQMFNERLGELTRRPDAPIVAAQAGGGALVRASEYSSLDAVAKEGRVLEALELLLTEGARVLRHGFLPAELDRARTELLRDYERAYAERDKTPSASLVGSYAGHFLSGEAIPGIAFEYELAKRLLPGVTLAQVNATATVRSGAANRVVTVTMPEKEGLVPPTEAAVRAVFPRVDAATIAPWTETVADGALVPQPPVPGRIVGERVDVALDITEWTLSNGAKVYVRPTDFNADQVLMTAWSPGGMSVLPDSDVFRGAIATTVIGNGGAGAYSQVDLGKKLSGKAAAVTPFIGDLSQGLNGRASPKDLETMLQLAWLRLTAPRQDSLAFRALLQQFEAVLKNRDANPMAVFLDTVTMTLGNGSPRVTTLSPERLRELEPDRLLSIYRERFADAGHMTFLFVGNVNATELKPLVERWIAPLPVAQPAAWRDVSPPRLAGQVEKVVRKGVAPQSRTLLVMSGAGAWSREESETFTALGELLETRLLDRLREALGATYSVSVNAVSARRPREEWQLLVDFGSAPAQADTLFAIVRQELDSLRRVAPSAAEVDRVKEQRRRQLELAHRQNSYWLETLRDRLEHGEDPGSLFAAEPIVAALTPERLAAAARRYLTEQNRARFVLLPETPPRP
ncbi:MAG: insulinase family protein [Gemmatimonadaceae bacterium]|nr:insulinase family protein [Gemmatimonadaceae bacterium]